MDMQMKMKMEMGMEIDENCKVVIFSKFLGFF